MAGEPDVVKDVGDDVMKFNLLPVVYTTVGTQNTDKFEVRTGVRQGFPLLFITTIDWVLKKVEAEEQGVQVKGTNDRLFDQDFADDIALIDKNEDGLQQTTDVTRETSGRVDQKRLNAFHVRCLRKILGITYRDRITNKEVYERTKQKRVADMISERRLRWFGHVIRMKEERTAKKILEWTPHGGKRNRGRSRFTWRTNVEKDLEATGNVSSWYRATAQAQNRTRWRRTARRSLK
ncbi:hypothetical protein Bbelb_085600 [Branchiostoma belcheri]|nr:hypothetical protein Bbelb_085600 [Branchiostoma belcheri]